MRAAVPCPCPSLSHDTELSWLPGPDPARVRGASLPKLVLLLELQKAEVALAGGRASRSGDGSNNLETSSPCRSQRRLFAGAQRLGRRGREL